MRAAPMFLHSGHETFQRQQSRTLQQAENGALAFWSLGNLLPDELAKRSLGPLTKIMHKPVVLFCSKHTNWVAAGKSH